MGSTAVNLLFGITWKELTLVSLSKFSHLLHTRGLAIAIGKTSWKCLLKITWLVWKVFAPYVLFRQFFCVLILQFFHEGILPVLKYAFQSHSYNRFNKLSPQSKAELTKLEKEMELASNYAEWRDFARRRDFLLESSSSPSTPDATNSEKLNRMNDKTSLYAKLVETNDVDELQFRLRSELHRKHWGLGSSSTTSREHPEYRKALNDYLNTVSDALALIAKGRTDAQEETSKEEMQARVRFFDDTLHSFGRTALLLSGGARLGLLHLGVIKALRDAKLLPKIISGSSAGSIVAVMLGAFRDDELDEKLFSPEMLNLHFFEFVNGGEEMNPSTQSWFSSLLLLPPPFPLLFHAFSNVIPTYLKTGALLNVHVLAKAIRDATGDLTFKEAFERTGRMINITVSPSGNNEFPFLLNYLTAPQVLIWSASVASCAIPGVFAPVELLAKDKHGQIVNYYVEGMKWADGSVEADLPMQRLSELFNVNNFVVSQVNPHARFLAPIQTVHNVERNSKKLTSKLNAAMEDSIKTVVDFCRDQCRSSVKHFASALMVAPKFLPFPLGLKTLGKSLVPILTQKYTGDITIMPPLSAHGLATILVNPSQQAFLDDIVRGERMTWPHISRMRLSLAIENALDDCHQSCLIKLNLLGGGSGSPRPSSMSRRVLSLTMTDKAAAAGSPVLPRGKMVKVNSVVTLSDKLKNRFESFADDLNMMQEMQQRPHDSIEEEEEEGELLSKLQNKEAEEEEDGEEEDAMTF